MTSKPIQYEVRRETRITETVNGYEHTCSRCAHVWRSLLTAPRACPQCKSPYWNCERRRLLYPEVRVLQAGQRIIVPWPEGHTVGKPHPVIRVAKASGCTITGYDSKGAYITKP